MSCVRCKEHQPIGTKYTYQKEDAKQPDGNPNPLICGNKGCGEPGLVWLNSEYEAVAYGKGERIFSASVSEETGLKCSPIAKIRVK